MKLPFGYEISFRKVKKPEETRKRLLAAVQEVNTIWAKAREEKLFLTLWLSWETKELTVTKVYFKPVVVETPLGLKKARGRPRKAAAN